MDKANGWKVKSTMVPRVEVITEDSDAEILIVGTHPNDEEPLVNIFFRTRLYNANEPEGRYVPMDDLRKLAKATAEYDKLLKKNKAGK